MNKKTRYLLQVQQWQTKYVQSPAVDDFCVPCERKGCRSRFSQRHHKGHEYLFACILPDAYAKRYVEFRKEDIVRLCDSCHKSVHRRYKPHIDRFFEEKKQLEELYKDDAYGDVILRIELEMLCEKYRKLLVVVCDSFLARKRRNVKRSRKAVRKGRNAS